MLYMVCPTCGELLGNKQLRLMERMSKLCNDLGIDDEAVSLGSIENEDSYVKERQQIIKELFKNICCRIRALNYVELVKLIKG